MLHNNERGPLPSVFSEGNRVQFHLQLVQPVHKPTGLGARL